MNSMKISIPDLPKYSTVHIEPVEGCFVCLVLSVPDAEFIGEFLFRTSMSEDVELVTNALKGLMDLHGITADYEPLQSEGVNISEFQVSVKISDPVSSMYFYDNITKVLGGDTGVSHKSEDVK